VEGQEGQKRAAIASSVSTTTKETTLKIKKRYPYYSEHRQNAGKNKGTNPGNDSSNRGNKGILTIVVRQNNKEKGAETRE
jgi:hypothetical protein